MAVKSWTRDELLLTFNLYCRTPFGRLHRNNPEVILLAQKIGRTPSAVAMKLVNFASFDPTHQARNVRGLSNASRADREIWDEFNANPERLAFESQQIYGLLVKDVLSEESEEISPPTVPTEKLRLVRTRVVQRFFREAVLASYDNHCAICKLDLPELLNASHIIPWSESVERRADPTNGLSLCAIHDRAFDRGLLTVSDSYLVIVARKVRREHYNRLVTVALLEAEGGKLSMPGRFSPDPLALEYHRRHRFQG